MNITEAILNGEIGDLLIEEKELLLNMYYQEFYYEALHFVFQNPRIDDWIWLKIYQKLYLEYYYQKLRGAVYGKNK